MKRFFITMLISLISIFSYANEFHYYFSMNAQGEVVSYEISEHAYTVTINDLIISAFFFNEINLMIM